MSRPRPPDHAERARAIAARTTNVLIDAGAGAGKTTLLVERILMLIAPTDDTHPAIPLSRLAAVTFTRRGAGELRLRVRAAILEALGAAGLSDLRRTRLLAALGGVDGAALGTIHGFADRLLRLQPMKARLSPSYRIHEDADALIEETFERLLHAAQQGALASELTTSAATAIEVEHTLREALRARVLVYSEERDPIPPKVGLDFLVAAFIEFRDRELAAEPSGDFDREGFAAAARDFLAAMRGVDDDSEGARWMLGLAARLQLLLETAEPMALYELVAQIKYGKKHWKQRKDFVTGSAGQAAFKAFLAKDGHAARLTDPLQAMLAARLARTRHAVLDLYAQVKTRHEALDTMDLLLALRDLLRDDLDARAFYQRLFDHILVDELQDTDPLQTEVLLYLTEAAPIARRWQDVVVGPGRLTLVGDPKQSIYRFRRADVGMYQALRDQIARGDHEPITLSANFRSTAPLIAWTNHRFAEVLGTSKQALFDAATGQVFHQRQVPGKKIGDGPCVHAVPYGFANGEQAKVEPARALEGEAVVAYLRWLVERSGHEVRDPDTQALRPVRWGDVAVLALVTSNVRYLTDQLDLQGVPYAVAGGTLFTRDPLHQRFLLGLRALADRHDGVAEATLLRPPFFGVDLLDLVRERAGAGAGDEAAARGAAARAWLMDARKQRFARTPGQTARALLEETGLGRAVALGPNGAQRLRHLRELCLHLEAMAAAEGLDYDGVTARMRDWLDHPPKIDAPRPVGVDALQVLTVHGAKGLEFPVVVLWDGVGQWPPYNAPVPWLVGRDGDSWAMKTNDVQWEEPADGGVLAREKAHAASERRRLVYVAATRARDLLIVPHPTWDQAGAKYIHALLLEEGKSAWVHRAKPYVQGKGAQWSKQLAAPPTGMKLVEDAAVVGAWEAARAAAVVPRAQPTSVTALAKGGGPVAPVPVVAAPVLAPAEGELEVPPPSRPKRVGRYGSRFGDVVHQAIGLALTRGLAARAAVDRAAQAVGVVDHLDEAADDVQRALAALAAERLVGDGCVVRLEYPVGAAEGGHVATGYIDLISLRDGELAVIDFKTDQWPPGATDAATTFPVYAEQVRHYGRLVGATKVGLLFTGTGRLAWVSD